MSDKEYIERGALIGAIEATEFLTMQDAATTLQLVTEAPAADVEPVVRNDGCEYCKNVVETNSSGREFHKPNADDFGFGTGELSIAIATRRDIGLPIEEKPEWYIHYEDVDDTGIQCDVPIKFCPYCGRQLPERKFMDERSEEE